MAPLISGQVPAEDSNALQEMHTADTVPVTRRFQASWLGLLFHVNNCTFVDVKL